MSTDRTGWRHWLFVFLLIVTTFAAAAGYLSASLHLRRVEQAAEKERRNLQTQAAAERVTLGRQATSTLSAQAKELLRMAALPLSWAVGRALDERDHREIGIYFQQLVAIPGVRRVALILRGGEVKLASDKSLEGKPATKVFPDAVLDGEAPTVQERAGRSLEAVVPIMGLNTRLGTLIVDYQAPDLHPEATPATSEAK